MFNTLLHGGVKAPPCATSKEHCWVFLSWVKDFFLTLICHIVAYEWSSSINWNKKHVMQKKWGKRQIALWRQANTFSKRLINSRQFWYNQNSTPTFLYPRMVLYPAHYIVAPLLISKQNGTGGLFHVFFQCYCHMYPSGFYPKDC